MRSHSDPVVKDCGEVGGLQDQVAAAAVRRSSSENACEKDFFDKCGKPFKEAIPYPIPIVSTMEEFVMLDKFNEAEIFWILRMLFASLRFDEAIHVKARELDFKEEGLFGVSWQTKTRRKRRRAQVRGP